MDYYTSIVILIWMALAVMCILVWENNRLPEDTKRIFYLTYVLVAVSVLAEWLGVKLNGNTQYPLILLTLVKVADYILTPMAGGALCLQIAIRGRITKAMNAVLGFNIVFQLVSVFFGWVFYIDENGFYHHGPLYPLYAAVYVLVLTLIFIRFIRYGQAYRNQNNASLFATLAVIVAGTIMQVIIDSSLRTSYLSLTLGAALLFIHYNEFIQLSSDDYIRRQKIEITTDDLTGLLNRRAYSQMLKRYHDPAVMPEDMTIFLIDINGLKEVNDTLGHEAGDELICGAADCIRSVFGEKAYIYRIGGDEFTVVADLNKPRANDLIRRLNRTAHSWSGEKVLSLRVASGYASALDHPGLNLEELARIADREMYKAKSDYYVLNGIDRRHH